MTRGSRTRGSSESESNSWWSLRDWCAPHPVYHNVRLSVPLATSLVFVFLFLSFSMLANVSTI
jgi:hypothetical protein